MNQHLTSDDRGILLTCPKCGTSNRVAFARLDQQGRCGSCKSPLPGIATPVDIQDASGFAGLIAQSPLPVVVDFWAPWCGPCKSMAPEFAKAASEAAGEAVFAKVQTEDHPEIASQFAVQGIPAFVLLRGGELIARNSGFQSAARLLSWVRQHRAK